VAQQTVNIDLCAGFQNLVRVSGANVASFGLSASAVNCGTPAGPNISITVTGIINNLNQLTNLWSGTVTVGSQTLSAANYPFANATLGNGSIGRVPFNLHDASSSPVNNLTEAPNNNSITSTDLMGITQTPPRSIVLEFDGPIEFSGSAAPVKITLLGTT
jgi:hypothetical protein